MVRRVSSVVAAVALGAAALVALGTGGPARAAQSSPAPPAAAAPTGTDAADAALRARVLSALTADEQARDLPVSADVKGGVAVLRGRVPHLAARDSAVQVAARVRGLLDVRDEIEIPARPGGDAELREALGRALAEELRSIQVEVEVKNGVATLRGRVRNPQERAAARNRALRVEGLQGVDNQLVSDNEAQLDDVRLRARLVELIENRRLYPIEGDIRVQVQQGQVTLTGEVPRVFDRLVAEKVVGIVSSVRGLRNEIKVVPVLGREVTHTLPVPPL